MLSRHVRYFLAVAENGSFTRAALALHVSQPALSQQIKQLEDSLGAQLFDRSGRVTRLTDAGETYATYARKALRDLEEGKRAIHDVADLSRGSLRIGLTPTFTSYVAGPLVEAFHERYPNVTLSLREMAQDRIEALLADDVLDVGIAFDDVRSADVEVIALMVESLALVVGRRHPLARRRRVGAQDIAGESLILLTEEFATRELIDRYCRENHIQPTVAIEANSISAVVESVRRTTLSTLLPAGIASASKDLFAIPLGPQTLQRTAALLWRKAAYRSAAGQAFTVLALDLCSQFQPGYSHPLSDQRQ
jgi:LysR family transcriptional regulator, cyn operon transcriptional activator